jgi:quinone-modifying oxidoreductase subunit QmoB
VTKTMAVYVCQGCGIGDAVDVEALCKVAKDELGVERCVAHPCLCGDAGRALLAEDVAGGVNTQVVAACSPRFMTDAFAFDGCFTERVNLREQVIWSHEPKTEDTQALAEDYLRMGIVRAQKAELPEPFQAEIDKTVLVVGGGVTGLTAALGAAGAGYRVVVVEKEKQLGGWLARFAAGIPHRPPYRDPMPTDIAERIAEVEHHERITVHTGATIERIAGQPGQFDVSLKANGSSTQFRVGAIVQATGWKPYDATKLGHLGYGRCPNVITNVEMEAQLRAGRVVRPGDGKPARRIAFIQCAGSRDKDHLPYCSAVCCRVTIKQALLARQLDPGCEAYVLYKDIRTPGQYEEFYRRAQEDAAIFFTKADVTGVSEAADHNPVVEAEHTLLGDQLRLEADLVVLATGMVPASADGEAIRRYVDAKAVVAAGQAGAQLESAKETVGHLKHLEGTAILNLDYRQGPDLPALRYDFSDSHFICFPYETRRTGIYAAGCVRAPNDAQACREDGAGAALKAIQTLELAAGGAAVQPRIGDRSYPEFNLQRCTQCKRCTEECPFGTLNEDVKGTPQPNPLRCRRCGICLGACPERIISFKDYSVEIVSSMIKAVQIPDEFEEKPRLLGLICENDAYPALDVAGLRRLPHSPFIRFIPVRCLGSVNVVWIADALARGFDGILLLGCKSGADYQCHFIRGSELMATRSTNIRDKLKQLALEEERVRIEEISIADSARLPEIVNEFAAQIEAIGLNPFKGS